MELETYEDCLVLLRTFAVIAPLTRAEMAAIEAKNQARPNPRRPVSFATAKYVDKLSFQSKLRVSFADRGLRHFRTDIMPTSLTDSFWYKYRHDKDAKTNTGFLANWETTDTLDVLTVASFAIPGYGCAVAAALTACSAYLRGASNSGGQDSGGQILEAIKKIPEKTKAIIKTNDIETLIAEANRLKDMMAYMFGNAAGGLNGFGIRPEWFMIKRSREDVLDRENGLGRVFLLLTKAGSSFSKMYQQDSKFNRTVIDDSIASPVTIGHYTIQDFCYVISVAAAALQAYMVFTIVPDEAFEPEKGWDWDLFDMREALKSPFWKGTGDKRYPSGETAAKLLREHFSETDKKEKPVTWIGRLDPEEGDAATAYKAIHKRLETIKVEYGVSSQDITNDGFDEFADADDATVSVKQDRLVDTSICKYDKFADAFKDIKTTYDGRATRGIGYHPWVGQTYFPRGFKSGEKGVLAWRRSGRAFSPFEGGTDIGINSDAVTWMAYVLSNYCAKFNFRMDPSGVNSYRYSLAVLEQCLNAAKFADQLLDLESGTTESPVTLSPWLLEAVENSEAAVI